MLPWKDEEEGAEVRILIALRYVAKAHGMSVVAKKSEVARQALYRILSEEVNPDPWISCMKRNYLL